MRAASGHAKRKMLALALAQCAFTLSGGRRTFLSRAFLGAAGAATSTLVLSPLPSSAAASPQQVLKSRAIYGSRVFRLQDASAAVIIDEKNVFDLFLTGAHTVAVAAAAAAAAAAATAAAAAAVEGVGGGERSQAPRWHGGA